MANAEPIRVAPVESAGDLRQFIALPHRLYASDPHWVAPLNGEVHKLLDRKKNPFFTHGEAAYWLAWRGSEPVGRISAQINRLHLDTYHDATGNFGFIEAIDDPAVWEALLATSERWLRARGMKRSVGPYSLTVNDEIGVMISGFDTPPSALMGHALPYYGPRLEEAGYDKARDVMAYRLDRADFNPSMLDRLNRVIARMSAGSTITSRNIDLKRFNEEMHLLLDIYNEAWTENWGFLPVTDAEAQALIASIKPIIRKEQVIFAAIDGKTVGVLAAIPNINEILADLHGSLLPFGWAKLLWRLKFAPPKSVRVILAGVRSEYRNSALSGAILSAMVAELVKYLMPSPVQMLELSWILEDNKASIGVAKLFASLAKTYRIYEKDLDAA
ncbi:MAG TPA: dATP pyrophosphohydrolase [Stellaceae bacterium]